MMVLPNARTDTSLAAIYVCDMEGILIFDALSIDMSPELQGIR
jgi:hypothetical protein